MVIAGLLIAVVLLSAFLAVEFLTPKIAGREFYVGVEYAYGNQVSEVKQLVDKVKDYTNLFVLGSVNLTFNRPALDEACDYIVNSNLNLIVLFTGSDQYNSTFSIGFTEGQYTIFNWMVDAKQKYGDKLLGIYRYDEPGGNQLDNGTSRLIQHGNSYQEVSASYTGNLSFIINYYRNYSANIFTSDYGLYWFDYKANYSTLFAECVGNESRERAFGLCRGAAEAFGRNWGTIITWKYDQAPYLESGTELSRDLSLAYEAGAKYGIVFSYPKNGTYGILTQEHFDALQQFWDTLQNHADRLSNPPNSLPRAAYILPKDYGFGFRSPNDTIWGLFPPDEFSAKIYTDTQTLTNQYGVQLDILYDGTETLPLLANYSRVYYYNQTVT